MNGKESSAGSQTIIRVFYALVTLAVGASLAFFVYGNATNPEAKFPFRLGLDLSGGSHLIYEADVSGIAVEDVPELMNVLRDVIERRVNVFGVSEPIVQVESSSFVAEEQVERLVVELPGVTDVAEAIKEIGKTPLLEFKLLVSADSDGNPTYADTGLTGRYLESAQLQFVGQSGQGGLSNEPIVAIAFNSEGAELFENITRENVGETLAIFLDDALISAPRINEAISGGEAVIQGNFKPDEARDLAENLNFGALPVPITLVNNQTIDATLGAGVIEQSYIAGIFGFLLVSLFLILWYRVLGLMATIALFIYVVVNLALFMVIPVTLTAAGLAGFVLSLGMAVDANVLVFERMKEEYRSGKSSRESAYLGFKRAWSAIRDGNITGLISAIILFWFGTSMIKGFALVLGIGIIVSVLSAIFVTRTLIVALPDVKREQPGLWSFLFGCGLKK